MEKVLVMGGSYFIGRKIVEVLLENDYDVYLLNRGTQQPPNGAKQIICDRDNIKEMEHILNQFQFSIVIDVSGLNKEHAHTLYHSLNKKMLKKFIFISSSAVYDIDHLQIPFKENDALSENKYWTQYGKNKIEAEQTYQQLFLKDDIKLIIIRPPYVYGENNYAQRESFIFDHLYHQKPILIPISNPRLQFIYTSDLANIIVKLLDSDLLKESIFNVGNTYAPTAKEWVEACGTVCKKTPEIIMYDYQKQGRVVRDFFPFHDYSNVLDVSKINEYYNQETDFEVGLKEALAWYLDNKDDIHFKEEVLRNEMEILAAIKNIL